MRLAALLHLFELLQIELLVFDGSPIVSGVVHGKTRRECSIRADNQPVLASTAAPMSTNPTHEALHVLQARNGVDHLPALTLLVDEPVQ